MNTKGIITCKESTGISRKYWILKVWEKKSRQNKQCWCCVDLLDNSFAQSKWSEWSGWSVWLGCWGWSEWSLWSWRWPLQKSKCTRPSVNYAKDWLDQLFFISGLAWSGKGYHLWMWSVRGSQQPFSCVLGHFRLGDNQMTKRQWVILECKPALDQWEGSLLQKLISW